MMQISATAYSSEQVSSESAQENAWEGASTRNRHVSVRPSAGEDRRDKPVGRTDDRFLVCSDDDKARSDIRLRCGRSVRTVIVLSWKV